MFLPIGDSPNPKGYTPFVNYALIGLNVAVYLLVSLPLSSKGVDPSDPSLMEYLRALFPQGVGRHELAQVLSNVSAYDLFVFRHGYKPGAPELSDLLACMFLHGGLLHLVGNMLFLWIFGDNVEHRLGRAGYLLVYLATGAVATWAFSVLAGDSMVPLVGASGAISGVLGLYFLLFRRNRVKVAVLLFPFLFDVWLIPARFVLGFYVIVDNLLPFILGAESGVAYGAHLGGFLGGLAVAGMGERFAWRWPWTDRHWRLGASRPRPAVPASGIGTVMQALRERVAAGDREGTITALSDMSRQELASLSPQECVMLAEWLDRAGHSIAAVNLLRLCTSTHRESADMARVYLTLGLLRLRQGQAVAAYQYLLSVFDFNPPPDVADSAHAALNAIPVYRRGTR